MDFKLSQSYDLASFLRGFYLIAHAIENAAKDAYGLTVSQYEALLVLDGQPGSRPADLCSRLPVKANTVSLIVGQLVKRRFVDRQPDPRDNRASRLFLTETGKQALDATGSTIMEELRHQWRHLTHGQAQVVSRLEDPFDAPRPSLDYLTEVAGIARTIGDVLKPRALTPTQLLVLVVLQDASPAELRPVQIERLLDLRSNTLAAAVKNLEGRDLVRGLRQNPRAGTQLRLTHEGKLELNATLTELTPVLDQLLVSTHDAAQLPVIFSINSDMIGA